MGIPHLPQFFLFPYTVKFLTPECRNQSSQLRFCVFFYKKRKRQFTNLSSEVNSEHTEQYLCTVNSHNSEKVLFIILVSVWKGFFSDERENNNFQNHIMCDFMNLKFFFEDFELHLSDLNTNYRGLAQNWCCEW